MEQFLFNLATNHPNVMTVCVLFGAIFAILTAVRPLLYWLVKKTPSEKDDKVVAKIYYFFDYLSPDIVGACIALFRKKKPEMAATVDKVAETVEKVKTVPSGLLEAVEKVKEENKKRAKKK